uniref:Uncharacterized protein n=1 Tax=Arundo donax TaxID=35708 RepID=A0A0A9HDN8_ARUDO
MILVILLLSWLPIQQPREKLVKPKKRSNATLKPQFMKNLYTKQAVVMHLT